jgi:hypothetical protein
MLAECIAIRNVRTACETGHIRSGEPNKEQVIRGSRKLLNEELHNLYSSANIIKARSIYERDDKCT